MMKAAGYEGFYSGHSLRRSGGSRLFLAGMQQKLVKECTGHMSDAVDKYQITSEEQRETISNILVNGPNSVVSQKSAPLKSVCGSVVSHNSTVTPPIQSENDVESANVDDPKVPILSETQQCCKCMTKQNDKSQFGGLIEQIVASVNANGKTKIKIEIEISND